MNRYEIEQNMGNAREVIKKQFGGNSVDKMMRSKISAFGAMVLMSGVRPTICFYMDNEPAIVDLVAAMYEYREPGIKGHFFNAITKKIEQEGKRDLVTENILNDSVSLKLAFNLFELKEMPKNN